MVHGLTQSENQAKAQRNLAAAKVAVAMGLPGAEALLETVHAKSRKALQEYIDPFKVHRQW